MPDDQKQEETSQPIPRRESIEGTIVSGLAALAVGKSIREGNEVEIPSLQVTISKDDLIEPQPSRLAKRIQRMLRRTE